MRILLASVLLVGCSTTEQPKPVILTNKDKDNYIEKVEQIVSDANSALSAVAPTLDDGIRRQIIEGQITRLSGIREPSVERVESYRRMVTTNDTKAVKEDQEKALKVESETNKLWAIVEEQESAIAIAEALAENSEKERQREMKDKILWMVSCIGMAIVTAGLLAVAFTPFKSRGLILVAGGALATSFAWIVDTNWFAWMMGLGIGFAIADGLYILVRYTINRYRHRPQAPDKQ
jgi:hypothetical protein